MPETRARISTSRDPSACPTASSTIGTRRGSAVSTVTGIAGGGPFFAASFLATSESDLPHAVSSRRMLAHAAPIEIFFANIIRDMQKTGDGGGAILYNHGCM